MKLHQPLLGVAAAVGLPVLAADLGYLGDITPNPNHREG